MSIINTNVMSLNSQRNLAANNASLGTTIQRLSSGLRINSAKDDAAGLAISERFTTQIRGMNQAARNANDGISLAQTAEGALAEIGNNLQRIRELSVQSRNATNSIDDRKALDAEAQLLKAEIQRVADQTTFNGTKLLDGQFMNQAFQVGADQGQVINIAQLADANTNQLGNWTSVATSASLAGVAATGGSTGGTATVTGTAPTGTGSTTPGTGSLNVSQFGTPTDNTGTGGNFDYAGFNITVGSDTIAVAAATGATDAAARTALLTNINAALAGANGGTGIAGLTINSSTPGTLVFQNASASALTISGPAEFGSTVTVAAATAGPTSYAAINAGEITINGQSVGPVAGGQATAAARGAALAAAINALNAGPTPIGVTAASDTNGVLTLTSSGPITVGGPAAASAGLTAGTTAPTGGTPGTFSALSGGALTINGVSIDVAAAGNASQRASALVKAINTAAGSNAAMTGVSASLVGGNLQIRSSTGDMTIGGSMNAATMLAETGLTAGTTAGGALAGSTAYAVGTAQVGFSNLSIATADGADNAILAMDAALNAVNSARAELGAIQNRFSSVVSNLNTTSENLSASRSRIRDTDFAKETAELTRTQILNQAGTAMLAQANQAPQGVLSLLR